MDSLNKEQILKKGSNAAKIATIATALLALIKGVVGLMSGSLLLIADAIHTTIDILAIFSSWFGLKISQKKYNENFPYGYYKAENFATLVASLFIFYAAYEIFIGSYHKLFFTSQFELPFLVLAVPLLSSFVSYFIAVYENKVGKEIGSQSLIANAQESKIDVISSLVVFGGILLSYFDIKYIESLVGMGLAFMIVKIGYQNAKNSIYSLMDTSPDKELEKQVKDIILKTDNVKDISNLRLRQSGLFVFGEASIKLAGNMNVSKAHDVADLIEKKIKNKISKIELLTIHIEPYKAQKIKILLPVENDEGLNSKIIGHFGRAKYFLFVILENNKITSFYVKENKHLKEKIRAGLTVSNYLIQEDINILLVKEIGEISFHTLRDSLVDIYLIKSDNIKEIISDFKNNKLEKLTKPTHLSNK